MSVWYDRKGNPLGFMEWARLLEDRDYQRVDLFEDDRVRISTVWLGLDHSFGGPRPRIFETMIFAKDKTIAYDEEQWRWGTEREAKEAHNIIVGCYKENLDPHEALKRWAESIRQGRRNP
jgi:hypothetical protein